MARIYEYQGKEVLSKQGIPVPRGKVAGTPQEAKKAAQDIATAVVIKAQVWTTGRFKSGGIKFAENPAGAEKAAREILGSSIKGNPVNKVLVEEKLDIDREFYAGITISDSHKVKGPVLIVSTQGGVDLEEVAAKTPEKVAKLNIEYLRGVSPGQVKDLVHRLGLTRELTAPQVDKLIQIIGTLFDTFRTYDARAVEINPLVLLKNGEFRAADCRLTIDDNSVFKHPEFGIKLPRDMVRPATELEEIAWSIEDGDYRGTGYFAQMVPNIEGKGWIGFHGIGGGGSMLGASAFIARGFKIANYADTSGDPTASKVYRVIKVIFSQPIDGYVLMGACLANQEQWHHAHAVVKVLKEESKLRPGFPVILLIAGNKEKEAHEIIRNGLKDLPLRWELYGRDYIYNTGFIADRVEALVTTYQQEKYGKQGG